jgi:sulfate/thiosulfate transport system ATP-binding protein
VSVRVERLSKQFSGAEAVSDASFAAPSGAITALLGPSGSGKTTLLRLIAGLEVADAGSVFLDGHDCTRVPVQKRGVGFVFQGYALFEHLSVRENVAFGLRVRRLSAREIRERVDELLELVQLHDHGRRHPSQLSGGQRQRVAFARALATRPRVLLLDEPFGALDARVRIELRGWLRRLHDKTQLTTVLVTHDQEEALELSQHVVVLHEGRVEQSGTPLEIYDHPASRFVASFVGEASVLRGHIRDGRASVGPHTLNAPAGVPEGATVHAFVRPHDVQIARVRGMSPPLAGGVVEDLSRVAASVKVALRLDSGERLTIRMAKAGFDGLRLARGDRVQVELKGAKVFVEEGIGT